MSGNPVGGLVAVIMELRAAAAAAAVYLILLQNGAFIFIPPEAEEQTFRQVGLAGFAKRHFILKKKKSNNAKGKKKLCLPRHV